MSVPQAAAFVELVRQDASVREHPLPSGRGLSAAPDDEFVIDVTRAAAADAIVSGDARLLDLRGSLRAMSPAEFLATLRGRVA